MSDLATTTLGYANNRPCQIALPPPSSTTSPIYLEEGKPVTTPEGYLTGFQAKLEGYVRRGLLKRIVINDPVYGNWNARVDSLRRNKDRAPRKVAHEVTQGVQQTVTISSREGIQFTDAKPPVVREVRPKAPMVESVTVPPPPVEAAPPVVSVMPPIVATAPPKKRGRPSKKDKAAAAAATPATPWEGKLSPTAEATSEIVQEGDKFMVDGRTFDSMAAAKAYLKVKLL